MKVLVFAHTPPPHHGQSYMVQLTLEGFGGDRSRGNSSVASAEVPGIECYHVNARFSKTALDIGGLQLRKLGLLAGYCLKAIWFRFRFGVTNFYYVPAPGRPAPLYRDWLVLLLCRPFFRNLILHWHAAGLATWLEKSASPLTRWISSKLLKHASLSIVLSDFSRTDGEKLSARIVKVVHNGIPDPCPQFSPELLPMRQARLTVRQKLQSGDSPSPEEVHRAGGDAHLIRLLYLSLCDREKGLFDCVEAVALANDRLGRANSPLRFHLSVGGEFLAAGQREEFAARVRAPDLQLPPGFGTRGPTGTGSEPAIMYLGFLSGADKARAFARSDGFCFPTWYHAESFGLVVLEAMAFGLPIVATRWRSVPELFPPGYDGLVDVRSPDQLAQTMTRLVMGQTGVELREHFLRCFTRELYLKHLSEALKSLEQSGPDSRRG
jgi:glycosyltransferase involved in cell wall biosynthesis